MVFNCWVGSHGMAWQPKYVQSFDKVISSESSKKATFVHTCRPAALVIHIFPPSDLVPLASSSPAVKILQTTHSWTQLHLSLLSAHHLSLAQKTAGTIPRVMCQRGHVTLNQALDMHGTLSTGLCIDTVLT